MTAPAGPVASAPLAAASIAAAPVAAAKALAPAARVAVAKGAFQIQIGAFGSPVEATNQISVGAKTQRNCSMATRASPSRSLKATASCSAPNSRVSTQPVPRTPASSCAGVRSTASS